ncbi:hypothetical protein D5R81_01855 [Parashewanella spongiae]|uniref:Uncharacterized protein n=1 Tax=Parashewanella spongiae TaxID=342950 RepID=A0A3A6UC88_9GAMM|nr:hypothetical protein [Parashewanella spongiae]MCL1076872.1 hypothetical protein [Parashewanella spongiae]RJY19239.1 hypothetical protein D5R81_01855 [Parashewanella spongiae]
MSSQFDTAFINQLQSDAWENIQSYQDPDTPDALSQYTSKMKQVLLADVSILVSLPEYLTVALFGNVRFPDASQKKWKNWLANETSPTWDEFKVNVAFNNDDIPLVKAVKEHSEKLLIQSTAAVYLLMFDDKLSTEKNEATDADFNEKYDEQSEDYSDHYDQDENY